MFGSQYLKKYWQGKSVIVTGASSGLGWAIVEALAEYGIHFCLLSRREERMEELADSLSHTDSRFWIRSCDVQIRREVKKAIGDFHSQGGRIDVLWVNAGISLDSSHENWNWSAIEDMIDTNLKGAIYTTRTAVEIMKDQGEGTVVGIGSAASMRGMPGRGVYSLTKIGLEYFLESQGAEFPELQFTIIHPGFVDTPLNRGNPNRFWVVDPDQAAQWMIKAVAKKKNIYIYPWQMRWLYRLVRLLPSGLFRWLASRNKELSKPAPQQIRKEEKES